ncbi:ABC transporter substrate-binding protein [Paenibacillus sp. IB182493]|uniref:ABC transporter substrate-binding protein n=2 Tax=Paenibacillus arenilitoris TaxID=2772299 RepID=A0A927H8Y0_9BACL|nr:ABC transporter substrate-binding protein [Paenibacillus arenilitoris]
MVAAISGCSSNGEGNSPGVQSTPSAGTDGGSAVAEYPSSFSYWVELDGDSAASLTNFSEVAAYKKLEEITGTKVEFKHPGGDGAQVKEQFNLMIASRNLTDVIQTNWLAVPKGPQNAIEEGTIIRLNELIDEHAPNFKKFLDENPDIANMIMTDKGDIYAFPFIRKADQLKVYYGPIVRQDWLDKLGLDKPATIADWEATLTAFRDQDPNGNGQKDEVPFLLETGAVRNESLNQLIGAWGILAKFYQKDGKVQYGELQPEYEQFMATLSDWYAKGLIDKDFPAVDGKLKDAKVTGDTLGAFYGFASGSIGKYLDLVKDHPTFALSALSHPALQAGGVSAAGQLSPTYPGEHAVVITSEAKNPEKIVKWLDLGYGEEGHMLFNFGIEGESYAMKDGKPEYTEVITQNPDGLAFKQAQARYMRTHFGGPFLQDLDSFLQQMKYPQQLEAVDVWAQAENQIQLPPITLTAEESAKVASIMNDVNTYSDEMIIKFIMGVEPMSNFADYVDTLKQFGVEEAIGVYQAALDRYNNR